ncbi:MAG: class I SAM-dependent methyltransferase [Acidobacteriota bacterium]
MAQHRVCPWWLGYVLASPVRRWFDDSFETVVSYAREGMTVVEPGPGMGFYTLELARRVGPSGRVVASDVQRRMLDRLKRRAEKAGLGGRIETRLARTDSLALDDLAGQADLAIACAVVHEVPDPGAFFMDLARALKPGGRVVFLEPKGHVGDAAFQAELDAAAGAGLNPVERPGFRRYHTAVLTNIGPI